MGGEVGQGIVTACSKLCPVGFGVAVFILGRSDVWFSWCRIQQPRMGRMGLQKKSTRKLLPAVTWEKRFLPEPCESPLVYSSVKARYGESV